MPVSQYLRLLSLLCLGLLLVLAGCTAGPFGGPAGQKDPVTVGMNNSANTTHTFETWVVEYPANVTVRRSDGLAVTSDIGPGLATHEPGPHYFTAVELPNSARLQGQYTLDPSEQNRSSIKEFPTDFAVVVVIYQDENEIVSWVSAHCDGDLVFLEVTMFHYGSGSAYNCEGGFF